MLSLEENCLDTLRPEGIRRGSCVLMCGALTAASVRVVP